MAESQLQELLMVRASYDELKLLGRGCAPPTHEMAACRSRMLSAHLSHGRSMYGEAFLLADQASGRKMVVKHVPLDGLDEDDGTRFRHKTEGATWLALRPSPGR